MQKSTADFWMKTLEGCHRHWETPLSQKYNDRNFHPVQLPFLVAEQSRGKLHDVYGLKQEQALEATSVSKPRGRRWKGRIVSGTSPVLICPSVPYSSIC